MEKSPSSPSLPPFQLGIQRKTGSHTWTQLPAAPSVPPSTEAFPSHLGSKITSLKLSPPPGPGSLTASSLHIQFAFQDFFHKAPTIRIPKPSKGESLDVFLPWGTGGDPWGEDFVPDSPLYLSTSILSCWREGRKRGENHQPYSPPRNQNLKQPTPPPQTLHSRWASLLIHSNSFWSVFTSTPSITPGFAALCSLTPPTWNLLLRSPDASSLQINQQVSVDSPSHLHWTDLSFLGSLPYLLLSSLLFIMCLLYFPSLSDFSLNIRASLSFWSWLLKYFPLSWQSYSSSEI